MKPRTNKEEPRDLPEWPEKVIGGKYVRLLEKVLRELRAEDAHGNRELFLDDVFVSYLLVRQRYVAEFARIQTQERARRQLNSCEFQ